MIRITPDIAIDEKEIRFDFIRSSGPGGQNVNKVATAVQLRFNVEESHLPEEVKRRLGETAGRRMTREGVLIIEAKRCRTQEKNRQDALDRLAKLIGKAAREPKLRKKTKPTRMARERRLSDKKHRSEIKKSREPLRHIHE